MPTKNSRSGSGRPPKFQEPSSPITVTLPERILRLLEGIDSDRAKAIVKCVETVTSTEAGIKGIEIVSISDDTGVLLIGPCPSLERIPWLHLVEIFPARFLISVPTGTAISTLEVALLDLIETLSEEQNDEKESLMELRHQISTHRRKERVSSREIFLLDM